METTAQPPALSSRQAALSLAAVVLVTVGALIAVVGVFLPFAASGDPDVTIVDNSPIAGPGPGIITIVGALIGIVLAAGRWRGVVMPWWIPSLMGLYGLGFTALWLNEVYSLSLYEIAYRGPYHASTTELTPGTGIWLAGAGSLVTLLGGGLFAAVPMRLMKAIAPPPVRVSTVRPANFGGPYGAPQQPVPQFGGPYGAPPAPPAPPRASPPPPAPPPPGVRPVYGPAPGEAPRRSWAPPGAPGSLPPWDDSTRPTSH